MIRVIERLFLALLITFGLPSLAGAQSVGGCPVTGAITQAMLEACNDSLNAHFARKMTQLDAGLARLAVLERDTRQALADLNARLATAGVNAQAKPGSVMLRSNVGREPAQDGNRDSFAGEIELNGWDGGLRVKQNYTALGTKRWGWSYWGGDSRGAWSFSWFPRADGQSQNGGDYATAVGAEYLASIRDASGAPASRFYEGQGLLFDQGTQSPYTYGLAGDAGVPLSLRRHVLISSQRRGWPMYFAVSPNRMNDAPENWAVLKLNADGSPNPVEIVVDGALRRVQSCTLPGGVHVLCY